PGRSALEPPAEPDRADRVAPEAAARKAFAAEVRRASRQREGDVEIAPQAPGEAREGLEDEGPRPDGGRVAVGRPLDEAVPRHRLRAHADHRMPAGRATDSRRGIAGL